MNITIFGGSSPKPGSQAYHQAYKLGQILAQAGHSVLTGGYIGTMEAVSRGASEAGGHVIGVTCSEIENWRPVKANAWVQEERCFLSLQDRLHELIYTCDAALALPGGPGTLTEIALTWNLITIQAIPEIPLILIGEEWPMVINSMFIAFNEYIPMSQRKFLRFAKDIETVCSMLVL
ncbi:MAG: hypothetical protein A2X25_13645 [Chloroflexi bacterium GWB2_49_20]|nr:MAG: hypothetical protein A2X25_13645 [Chloroflexi bacterium GWB2_49_20]OGN79975.1 MAG: hypothetical protein A2X26_03105 [Chloroflexi bacterium GWC2_49_37]OGN85489.1 MAG: hypothetical protein A2X27_03955 [Chloroflexi bacterium GWD2_49_16]HBG74358.1 DNA-binding protein [Anaerolineae bacterium]HCM97032.1 DNA-binding protein [Anaerolineae bacterium]